MLEFMVKIRKEMDWLDAKHLFLSPKDIFVFFGRLDQEHKKQATELGKLIKNLNKTQTAYSTPSLKKE